MNKLINKEKEAGDAKSPNTELELLEKIEALSKDKGNPKLKTSFEKLLQRSTVRYGK